MTQPSTTTAAVLAIAAILAAVAARYRRRNRQIERQIAILEGESHLLRQTMDQTQAARDASLRALNEVLLANAKRPAPTIMRFNGADYACYNVRSYYLN